MLLAASKEEQVGGGVDTMAVTNGSEELGPSVNYGELVLIGLNSSSLPYPTKFILKQRFQPNGLRPGQTYRFHHIGGDGNIEVAERRPPDETAALYQHPQESSESKLLSTTPLPVNNGESLSSNARIHFTLSKQETIVTNYEEDDKTDLFQVGRAESRKIDFRVDTPNLTADGTSTVSRFAFRILVKRKSPYTSRIFAAGFDEANRIVLGENAKKWQNADGKYDGLVTNGILIMKPEASKWREISVSGRVFPVRGQRWIPSKDQEIKREDNSLVDGTLIDVCGATLLWRSRAGLTKSADIEQLHKNVALLNKRHIICPVQLRTLIIKPHKMRSLVSAAAADCSNSNNNYSHSSKSASNNSGIMENDPFCYLKCGHVASSSLLNWGQRQSGTEHTCPLCRQVGALVRLQMGLEPSFYIDKELPVYAFKPCGHAASEQTVKYWSKIAIPFGAFGFRTVCPFCLVPLVEGSPYTRLIFEED